MTSPYFEDLAERYGFELEDLRSDSENKNVLDKRLQDKRRSFESLLPFIEDAPEMVAAALHGAFTFNNRALLDQASRSVPGLGRFPRWAELEKTLTIQAWAQPLIKQCLNEPDGDAFLVSTAVIEWMVAEDIRRPDAAQHADEDEDDDGTEDLAEAGEGWMAEQGFDSPER
jgi:hypothetical protein